MLRRVVVKRFHGLHTEAVTAKLRRFVKADSNDDVRRYTFSMLQIRQGLCYRRKVVYTRYARSLHWERQTALSAIIMAT